MAAASSTRPATTVARGIAGLTGAPCRPGGSGPRAGCKPLTATDIGLLPGPGGNDRTAYTGVPVSPLPRTTLSLRSLVSALTAQSYPIRAASVGRLPHALGYSLQGAARPRMPPATRTATLSSHRLVATVAIFLDGHQSVISTDIKAKEWVGNREPFQRCGSRVRMAAAMDDMIRAASSSAEDAPDVKRAMPRSTGTRAAESARWTVRWVGDSSPPGGRLTGVVTQGPTPVEARSVRAGMP